MNRLIIPFEMGSFGERKDKSIRITLYTNELPDDKYLLLRRMSVGFLCLQSEEIKADTTDLMDKLDVNVMPKPKSLSQELRQAIWAYWKQGYEDVYSEDEFYELWMNKIIQGINDKRSDLK